MQFFLTFIIEINYLYMLNDIINLIYIKYNG